ncbi:sodium-coupled monocarboxylate transporter 1-like isoform X3 [Scyliorhinus canicula]|uniref:sodium-coupled monocarboxylate transporter 1-like isoform X3 n=1 Tax=Scyliorhinus canicula TaxID=7830 RepID=UPI0018F5B93C|nr:sodium-coupled monocarboxylate transporter 1-like isoform X3 [Scyliorhinus canicula]
MAVNHVFQVWDYVVFVFLLLVSAAIGLFFAFKRGRTGQETTAEFLVGNRQISAYPIALSLASSFLSAITVIGNPAEVYSFGIMFLMFSFTWLLTMIATSLIYIPLFYRLNIISTYEYLNRRFGQLVRYQVVCCFLMYMFLYLGIVTYAPSLALSQVTGINLWISIVMTALVCTLYTALGGIKAVVWTDVFQLCIMAISLLTVLIQGSIHVGGLGKIWNIGQNGGRINFLDFDPDPRRRHTFWTILVGGTFGWTATYSCNQAQVQRYLACKSENEAKKAVFLNWIGMIIVLTIACLCGLVMYAVYETCDPIKTNKISNSNQLMPLLVVEILNQTPGVAGLFVAGAYSGTLSTISSGISAMAAVLVEDFIKPIWKPWGQLSNGKKTLISKLLAMIFGLATIGLAGVASLLQGNIIQASLSIAGIIQGPILGVFTLAALFPKSNGKGAFVGFFVGLALAMWVGIAAQIYPPSDKFTRLLATSTSGCLELNSTTSTPMNVTSLLTIITSAKQEERPSIAENFYSLSYLYYSPVACLSTVLVGLIVSTFTGGTKNLDPTLIAPIVHTIHNFMFKNEQAWPIPETVEKFSVSCLSITPTAGRSTSCRIHYHNSRKVLKAVTIPCEL